MKLKKSLTIATNKPEYLRPRLEKDSHHALMNAKTVKILQTAFDMLFEEMPELGDVEVKAKKVIALAVKAIARGDNIVAAN